MGADRRERAVERPERRGHQRFAGEIARVGYEIARGEIVGAVGDDVVAADEVERIFRREPRAVRFDGDMGIEPADQRGGALDLGHSYVGRGVDHLPLQVRQRDDIVIDDA